MKRSKAIEALRKSLINSRKSPFYNDRIKNNYLPVLGEGDLRAKIMLIGEAPGRNEAKTGRPFAGAAGKVLNGILEKNGIKRSSVYITNLVNDRPPANRDPLPREIKAYSLFLDKQLEIIKPKIIATLGRHSMKYIFGKFGIPFDVIGNIHGKVFKTSCFYGKICVIPLYHPAAGLYQNGLRKTLIKDFRVVTKNL